MTTNVRYSYMRSYFCLESISDGCARNLVGDCGVQVLMFVTLCRCVGIPAVFHGGCAPDWRPTTAAATGGRASGAVCATTGRSSTLPGGLALCGPGLRRRGLARGRSGDLELQLRQCGPLRVVTNTGYQAGFDAPERFFRIDPYDSQCGEMETEERGLQDGEFDSVQEITEFSVQ